LPCVSIILFEDKIVSKYANLTDQQLADAIAEKTATAHTERSIAALRGIPAHLAMAKRIDEQIAELKAEQARRVSAL
jgi:hypothetical protein